MAFSLAALAGSIGGALASGASAIGGALGAAGTAIGSGASYLGGALGSAIGSQGLLGTVGATLGNIPGLGTVGGALGNIAGPLQTGLNLIGKLPSVPGAAQAGTSGPQVASLFGDSGGGALGLGLGGGGGGRVAGGFSSGGLGLRSPIPGSRPSERAERSLSGINQVLSNAQEIARLTEESGFSPQFGQKLAMNYMRGGGGRFS